MKRSINSLSTFAMALFVFLFIVSCSNKTEDATATEEQVEKPDLSLSLREQVESSNNAYMTIFSAGDSVELAKLYTRDAKVMRYGSPAILGRESIQSTISGIMNSGITAVQLKTIEVWGSGEFIVEEGELRLIAKGEMVDEGKYIVLWKQEDGRWKLHRDSFNSNLPL